MPQSLVKNYIHLVFSTRSRVYTIDEAIQPELFRYIAGICANNECNPVQIGGHTNHVHALFLLSKKMALVKVVEEIKAHSSKWIKTKGDAYQNVYWQNGYGAFSVNPFEVDIVVAYIKNQKEHHRKKTFEEEYKAFLDKYCMAYDERYVWD
ncbi:IS200/IS605 family transposase [Flavisolibacter nicotianae]|uniref:IS200/IS605 family transposase n=1 Tax=Flavisolibacter nicotianae TaxID=2364882 RepID=UPI000EB328E6|nr:IS200/IS605 family transposase [Flavisolibacter nicotianae]